MANALELRRIRLMVSHPYGLIFSWVTLRETTETPTSAIKLSEPGIILFNPEFAAKLSDDQFVGVVQHQIAHFEIARRLK